MPSGWIIQLMGLGGLFSFSLLRKYHSTGYRDNSVSHGFSLKLWKFLFLSGCRKLQAEHISTKGPDVLVKFIVSPPPLCCSFLLSVTSVWPFQNNALDSRVLCIIFSFYFYLRFMLQAHKAIMSEFACLLYLLYSMRSTLSFEFLSCRNILLMFFSNCSCCRACPLEVCEAVYVWKCYCQ